MWILYGVLVVILAVVGYYVGKTYETAIGATTGTMVGVAAGAIVAGVIWYSQSEDLSVF